MPDSNFEIVDKVRRRINAGELPREHPPEITGGNGNGDPCCVCDELIWRAQFMNQLDVHEQTYRFHAGCYGLWVTELINQGLYKPD